MGKWIKFKECEDKTKNVSGENKPFSSRYS